MCTVTFIPKTKGDFILTSNRDEAPGRKTFAPEIYQEEGVQLMYPKDAVAGGTWIGLSGKKRAVSLMNGGFVSHIRKPYYRKSRGVVVKDFLVADDLSLTLSQYDFVDIEPFTAIAVEWITELKLATMVWDGEKLHINKENLVPKIWSSSPLYPENIGNRRKVWFSDFLSDRKTITSDDVLHFHKTAGDENPETNLIMDRGFVRTKSITQIVKEGDLLRMDYEDLQTGFVSRVFF